MKLIGLSCALIVILSIASGCVSKKDAAEKEAYFNDGKMDEQVDSWKKTGTRY